MSQHRLLSAIGEMAIPLLETPEQQEIINLKEKLEQEMEDHQKTKSQLEIAEIKLLDRASEVEGLRNTIQCLVLWEQKSSRKNLETENKLKIQLLQMELQKVSKKFDDYKVENDKKLNDYKLENNKKFDDLKEQISKGQMQESLQMSKELNEKLGSENARLQEELFESTTVTKGLEESIKELVKTNAEKNKKIQELEETIKQKERRLEESKKESSDIVKQFERRELEYEELKKKYEEKVVKLDGMVKLQIAMKGLELKNSQLQLQYQQLQQQLDETTKDRKSPIDETSQSEELKECLDVMKRYYDASFNVHHIHRKKLGKEYNRLFFGLSKEDRQKCADFANEYEVNLPEEKKRKMNGHPY